MDRMGRITRLDEWRAGMVVEWVSRSYTVRAVHRVAFGEDRPGEVVLVRRLDGTLCQEQRWDRKQWVHRFREVRP